MKNQEIQIIGIDLGTTNSVMARIDMNGPVVIRNAEGDTVTPSIVSTFKGKTYVGKHAYNRWENAAEDTIVSVKRLMGRAFIDPQVKKIIDEKRYDYKIVKPEKGTQQSVGVVMSGEEYFPEEISAMILRKIKDDASNKLGKEVTHAVITTPAYFADKQRYATKQAGINAGLTVMGLIDEPTAAAFAYGLDNDFEEVKGILVYDLGGGTFDVSVLMMTSGTYTLMAKEGDMWLGGDDFDKAIIDYVNAALKEKYGALAPLEDKYLKVRLKKAAREAKEALSDSTATNVFVSSAFTDEDGDPVDIDVEITREKFEELTEDLVKKTETVVLKALDAAMLDKDEDIQYVILAGNSSRMPMIQESLEKIFGSEKVKKDVPFKESVALGAAIYAARLRGAYCVKCNTLNSMDAAVCKNCGDPLRKDSAEGEQVSGISDIAPMSYGIMSSGEKYNIFINKSDPVPTPKKDRNTQTFSTLHPRYIAIRVYGGEDKTNASNNLPECEAFAILPPGSLIGTKVNIRLWLNRDNNFEVEAWLQDGTRLQPVLFHGTAMEKAFEALLEMEKLWDDTKGIVYTADDNKGIAMEARKEAIYKEIENKNADDAMKDIGQFSEELHEIKKAHEKPDDTKHLMAQICEGMVSKYRLFISDAEENEAKSKIQQNMEDKMSDEDFDEWFTKQFLVKNPQVLLLANIEIMVSNLEKSDSQKAMEFKNRYNALLERLKKGDSAAVQELLALSTDIERAIDQLQPKGQICEKCGTINKASERFCTSCHFDLWGIKRES